MNPEEKSCDTCLFYVDAMPDVIICIAGKHVKEYARIHYNCKHWLLNSAENAKEQLKLIKKQRNYEQRN